MTAELKTHDWPRYIRELRAGGYTDWKIAQVMGYDHPKEIEAIEKGRIPKHPQGEALIDLHASLIGLLGFGGKKVNGVASK